MNDQPVHLEDAGRLEPDQGAHGAPRGGTPESITRRERTERWFEVASSILLAIVAVATAWSGYQSARWDGVQAERYTQASAKRVESTRAIGERFEWVPVRVTILVMAAAMLIYGLYHMVVYPIQSRLRIVDCRLRIERQSYRRILDPVRSTHQTKGKPHDNAQPTRR